MKTAYAHLLPLVLLMAMLPAASHAGCFKQPTLPNGNPVPIAAPIIKANTPTSVFTLNGDGTVTDTRTKLTWKVCPEGTDWDRATNACVANGSSLSFTWDAALLHAKSVNDAGGFAGSKGWRVPNVKELMTIVEKRCVNPSINEEVFPVGHNVATFWSSSPAIKAPNKAWAVPFGDVTVNATKEDTRSDKSTPFLVRLVRD